VRKTHVSALQRALTLALLDANDANGRARRYYTTEHAAVWGHPLTDPSYTAFFSGGLIRNLSGISLDRQHRIPAPASLTNDVGATWDPQIATAVFAAVTSRNAFGVRLGRALYWLGHANDNADVPRDVRIFSLRTGFEMLFDAGADAETLAGKLDALLAPHDPRPIRRYTSRKGKPKSIALAGPGWWFFNFSQLRNKLTHSVADVPERAWRWGREHHFDVGDRQLRAAMRRLLVRELGCPDILILEHDAREKARQDITLEVIMRRHGFTV
jgi:hypothetical protein